MQADADTLTIDDAGLRRGRAAADARAEALDRRRTEHDLRQAIENDAFLLHYQLRRALPSGRPAAAEALIRWPHRKRGMVSPTLFIPVAERSALISQIGGWVLRAACAEAAPWPAPIQMAVKVAARQITDGVLLGQVATALERSGLAPERLILQFTEAVLIEPGLDLLLVLSALRDLGVEIAVDGFGTGIASLSLLRRLPVTALKLDRGIVRDVPQDPDAAAIVHAVIRVAHALDLLVIAEGIETAEQHEFLVDAGCDQGQGYHIAHPQPREALLAALGE